MAVDLTKIRGKLNQLQEKKNKSGGNDVPPWEKYQWKPSAGNHVIRIVPNYHDESGMPFIELLHHYGIGKRSYLSPASFGNPDPILEFIDSLKRSNDKDERDLAYKIQPKLRTYAPVIVRGEEDKGVRFWGFGKTVYEQLLTVMADEDWGDITDLLEGRDIAIEYVPPTKVNGKVVDFGRTTVIVKPKQTPVSEDQKVLEVVKNQPRITDLFREPSYEELEQALEKWLSPESEDAESQQENTDTVTSADKKEPEMFSDDWDPSAGVNKDNANAISKRAVTANSSDAAAKAQAMFEMD